MVPQYNHYYIHGRFYFTLCKSIESAAGLKALKPAANGCYSSYCADQYPTIDIYCTEVHLSFCHCMMGIILIFFLESGGKWTFSGLREEGGRGEGGGGGYNRSTRRKTPTTSPNIVITIIFTLEVEMHSTTEVSVLWEIIISLQGPVVAGVA